MRSKWIFERLVDLRPCEHFGSLVEVELVFLDIQRRVVFSDEGIEAGVARCFLEGV